MTVSLHQEEWFEPQDPAIWTAEDLFAQLDNRLVGDGSNSWVIEVLGIHVLPSGVWMQIAPVDGTDLGLVLHFSARATADHALAALNTWSRIPAERRTRVLEVTPF